MFIIPLLFFQRIGNGIQQIFNEANGFVGFDYPNIIRTDFAEKLRKTIALYKKTIYFSVKFLLGIINKSEYLLFELKKH